MASSAYQDKEINSNCLSIRVRIADPTGLLSLHCYKKVSIAQSVESYHWRPVRDYATCLLREKVKCVEIEHPSWANEFILRQVLYLKKKNGRKGKDKKCRREPEGHWIIRIWGKPRKEEWNWSSLSNIRFCSCGVCKVWNYAMIRQKRTIWHGLVSVQAQFTSLLYIYIQGNTHARSICSW